MKEILNRLMELHGTELDLISRLASDPTADQKMYIFASLATCHEGLAQTAELIKNLPE